MEKTLRTILFIIPALFICTSLAQAIEFDHNYAAFNTTLHTYVKDGMVDYQSIKTTPKNLNATLKKWGAITKDEFNSWSEKQQLAFLFNIYNGATIKLIVNNYPIDSIKDIGGFFKGPWDQDIVQLFGEIITLDHLEHKILRKKYNEPRLHMALVCAAKGCPPLRSEAYTAESFDAQLDDQIKELLSNLLKFKINLNSKTVYLSSIFKWYGDDFISKYSPTTGFDDLSKRDRAVANYISKHLPEKEKQFLHAGYYTVEHLYYDWSLNSQ